MPSKDMLIVIVTFGLLFVIGASLASGLKTPLGSVAKELRRTGPQTLAVVVSNFVLIPLVVGLTLKLFGFVPQAAMAFATLSVVAGAPFVAMFTKLAKADVAFAGAISLLVMFLTIPIEPVLLPWMLGVLNIAHDPVTPWHLLKPLLYFMLVPFVLGQLVKWRSEAFAAEIAPYCMMVAVVGIVLHVTLMFVAFWDQVTAELGTGEYLYSFAFPIAAVLVGYLVCAVMRPGGEAGAPSIRVPAGLTTAQRGSPALICSLIFAMGSYPVAGVVALGSSVITVVVLVFGSMEYGERVTKRAAQPAPRTGATGPRVGQPSKSPG